MHPAAMRVCVLNACEVAVLQDSAEELTCAVVQPVAVTNSCSVTHSHCKWSS